MNATIPADRNGFLKAIGDLVGSPLALEDTLADIGVDSLTLFEILIALENAGVSFPDELIESLVTVEDLHVNYLNHLAHKDSE